MNITNNRLILYTKVLMKEGLTIKEREKGLENVHGMMALIMKASGSMENDMGLVYILKKMEFYIRVNGGMI